MSRRTKGPSEVEFRWISSEASPEGCKKYCQNRTQELVTSEKNLTWFSWKNNKIKTKNPRALASLPEHPGLSPSTYMASHNCLTPYLRDPMLSSDLRRTCMYMYTVLRHTCTHNTHTHKIVKFLGEQECLKECMKLIETNSLEDWIILWMDFIDPFTISILFYFLNR